MALGKYQINTNKNVLFIMYQILQDHDGDLLLIIEPQTTEPDGPILIYDGGDTALLFRDWDSNVRLNNISEEARPVLKDAEEIFVVEMKKDRIIRDYMAPIHIVQDIKSLIA